MNKLVKQIAEHCNWEINMACLEGHDTEEAKWRSHVARRILSMIILDEIEDPYYTITNKKNMKYESKGYSMKETMEFVRDHYLQWELIGHHTDHDAYLEFHNYRNATHFCRYPHADENSLIEGIHFLMDMHYRNKAEEEAHASI